MRNCTRWLAAWLLFPLVSRAQSGLAAEQDFLIEVRGEVAVKREGWGQYLPANAPVAVGANDSIRVEVDAGASLICANLSIRRLVAGGTRGNPCGRKSRGTLYLRKAEALPGVYGEPDGPQVLSPRYTTVRPGRIQIRWRPVPKAVRYTVEIVALGWQATALETSLDYELPKTAGPGPYAITVTAVLPGDVRIKSQDQPRSGFRVLTAAELKDLAAREKSIGALSLQDTTRQFLHALLLAEFGLRHEAIPLLERLDQANPSPAVRRFLGLLHREQSLLTEAEAWYVKSASLAKAKGDIEGEVIAARQLSEIYKTLGRAPEATRQRELADRLAKTVGASAESIGNLRP